VLAGCAAAGRDDGYVGRSGQVRRGGVKAVRGDSSSSAAASADAIHAPIDRLIAGAGYAGRKFRGLSE
jgi:hypothetical protein